MLHMNIFLLNFNDFTITKMFKAPWDGVQRECGLKLFGLVFFLSPRGDFKLKKTVSRGLKVNG